LQILIPVLFAIHYIYKSTDAGDNWYQIGGIFPHDIYNIYCKDDNNLWVVGNFGMIMSSTNLGNMWENKSFDSTSLVYGITKNNNNIFINALTIDNSNRLFKSANMGNNWVNIPIDSLDSFFCLFFLFLFSLLRLITIANRAETEAATALVRAAPRVLERLCCTEE